MTDWSLLVLNSFLVCPKLVLVCPHSKREVNQAYQADLIEQMKQQQQLRSEQRAHEEREYQQGLMEQELYIRRKDEILSKDTSHTITQHPFRRADVSRTASLLPT